MYKAPCTVGGGLEFWVLIRPVLLGGGGWEFRVTAWCPLILQRSGLLPPRRDDRSSSLLGLFQHHSGKQAGVIKAWSEWKSKISIQILLLRVGVGTSFLGVWYLAILQ